MKTYIRLIIATLFMSFSATSITSAFGYLNVNPIENSSKIELELVTPTSELINFYIVDTRNREFHNTKILGTSDYNELIDLSELEDGRYTMITEVGNQKYNKVIRVRNDVIGEIDSYYTFDPVFKLEDNRLHIQHIDDRSNFLLVNIENQYGESYEEEFPMEVIFMESFSLEYLADGEYTIHLSTVRDKFSYDFEISR